MSNACYGPQSAGYNAKNKINLTLIMFSHVPVACKRNSGNVGPL
jgi:hypothetical protein